MDMLLSDIHLPALITSTLSEHAQHKSLQTWNNFDQLSCLWGVFTKCKKNIRDGFRLENLSWRLWYRQSVLQKKLDPKTSEDIDIFSTSTEEKKQLTRTRSLPDLSQWSHQKNSLQNKSISTPPKQKFSIMDDDEKDDDEEGTESDSEFSYDDNEEEDDDLPMTFTKKLSTPVYKSVSLLSDMLQVETSATTVVETDSNSGLRRCQSRYCRLDQYFASTV